jgi:hypothetical protein
VSIYDASTLGTDNNQITFNNYSSFPIYRVMSRTPQQRQVRDLDIPVPFESGVSDFETLIGRMAYVIEGKMYPSGEADYSTGLAALRKLASLDVEQDDTLSDDGYVPYVYSENGTGNRQLFLKVVYVDIREDTRQGLIQPFRLICKIKDPTIYEGSLRTANTGEAYFGTASGSARYPFKYPIVYGATTASVSVDANNIGDIPIYPVSINIHGPINVPKITNTTTGEYIEVSVNLGSSSDELVMAYDKDTLSVELNGVSVLNQVTETSTFFKIRPGSNIFQLSGSSTGSAAYATISFYSGWPLS